MDKAAFERLYLDLLPGFYRLAQGILHQPADADLRRAIDALEEGLRLPLLMKYMEGYTEREIAQAMDLSVPAVKSRLYRARRRLERLLKEEVELG